MRTGCWTPAQDFVCPSRQLVALAKQKPRYAYQRLGVLLARRGDMGSHLRQLTTQKKRRDYFQLPIRMNAAQ